MLLATRNRHKLAEVSKILEAPCQSLLELPEAPALVEDADTFAGNAAAKALQLARWLAARRADLARLRAAALPQPSPPNAVPLQILADDSGLEVDALGGAPGVASARFAALETGAPGNSSDADNNARLLRLLRPVPAEQRTARFRCVLALVHLRANGSVSAPQFFEGVCEGRILLAPAGAGGFGYDPLFVPEGHAQSFGELGEEVKNRISHRARALARLRAELSG